MAYSSVLCRSEHFPGFIGVAAERPFSIDVLARLDCRHDRQVMVGNLHTDSDQVDIRMLRELLGIGKCERDPEMLRRRLSRILPGRANSANLEIGKRLQSWEMGYRGEPAARIAPIIPTRILLFMTAVRRR